MKDTDMVTMPVKEIDITGEIIETTKRKKLIIASDCFLPRWDGISRFLLEVIPNISDEYDITILTPKFPGKFSRSDFEKFDKVEIIRFPVSKIRVADYNMSKPSLKIIRLFIKQADIVWTQTIAPIGAAAILYGKRYKKPVISYVHSIDWELATRSLALADWIGSIMQFLVRKYVAFLYNRSTVLIVPTLEVAEIMSYEGIRTKKLVLGLGTDTAKFKPSMMKEESKKAIGIDPSKTVIGFMGRLAREKDPMTLFRAFLRLNAKHKNLVLLCVGGGIDNYVKIMAKKENIIMTGSVNNVIPYLQAMDMYVLPSLVETTSLSTIEAMACGIAPICTPVGHIKEYIKEGYNGLLFPKKDSYMLSRKIESLIVNPSLCRKMGENARATVVKQFSWDKTIAELKAVLKSY